MAHFFGQFWYWVIGCSATFHEAGHAWDYNRDAYEDDNLQTSTCGQILKS